MDIKTILICLFIIDLFMGFYTYIIKKTQPTFAGINYWIYSNFLIAIGYLLISQRTFLPDFLSIITAQIMFLYGGLFRIRGLQKFFGKSIQRKHLQLIVLLSIFYLLFLVYFTYYQKNIFIRTFLIGIVLSAISAIIGFLIFRNREPHHKYTYYFTASTFFTFSFIFLLRITDWLFTPNIRGLFIASFINNLQFISSMVIDIAWTTMFFVIHNQKLTLRVLESEEKFRTIFEKNSSPLALVEYDSTITLVNDAFCQVSGYKTDEVTGLSWTKFIPQTEAERLLEYNRIRLNDNAKTIPDRYEFTFYSNSGEIRHAVMSISILPSIQKIIASFIDITERRNNEIKLEKYARELDHLNKGKDRFISILAHDLKGPFSYLIGLSELLLLNFKKADPGTIENQLHIFYQTTKKTFHIFEDLLLWSASNLGKLSFNPEIIHFNAVCQEIIENYEHKYAPKNIRVQLLNTESVTLFADIHMVRAILRNLISNAIKFTNINGEVTIMAENGSPMVTIIISDNGVGISEENQKKLWNISQSFTTYGTNNEKGTGLGLILCRDLIEKHGGNIRVESKINQGSKFIFTLPANA